MTTVGLTITGLLVALALIGLGALLVTGYFVYQLAKWIASR